MSFGIGLLLPLTIEFMRNSCWVSDVTPGASIAKEPELEIVTQEGDGVV